MDVKYTKPYHIKSYENRVSWKIKGDTKEGIR